MDNQNKQQKHPGIFIRQPAAYQADDNQPNKTDDKDARNVMGHHVSTEGITFIGFS